VADGRSADCQSAVAQVANLRGAALVRALELAQRFADWQSAIQQTDCLHYNRKRPCVQIGLAQLPSAN